MGGPSQLQTGLGAALGGIGEAIGRHREADRQVAAAKALQDALNARESAKLDTETIDPGTPLGKKYFQAMTGLTVDDADIRPGQRFNTADLARIFGSNQKLAGEKAKIAAPAKVKPGQAAKDDAEWNNFIQAMSMGPGNISRVYHSGRRAGVYNTNPGMLSGQFAGKLVDQFPVINPKIATYRQQVEAAGPAIAAIWASGKGGRMNQALINGAKDTLAKPGTTAEQALDATRNVLNESNLRSQGFFARDMDPAIRAHRQQVLKQTLASVGVDPETWQPLNEAQAGVINSDYKKNPAYFKTDPEAAAHLQGAKIAAPDMDWR